MEGVDDTIKFICENDINTYEEEVAYIREENEKAKRQVSKLISEKEKISSEKAIIDKENKEMKLHLEKNELEKQIDILQKKSEKIKSEIDEINERKNEYNDNNKKIRTNIKLIASTLSIILIACIIILIKKLTWNVMEPITYMVGTGYLVIAVVIKMWKSDVGTFSAIDIIVRHLAKITFNEDDESKAKYLKLQLDDINEALKMEQIKLNEIDKKSSD